MFKKNLVFIILLIANIVVFSALAIHLSKQKQEKIFIQKLNTSEERKSSSVVNQKNINEKQRFVGKVLNTPQEKSVILLEWDYDRNLVKEAEILLNGKLFMKLQPNQTHVKLGIMEYQLKPTGNQFQLRLTQQDEAELLSTISVDANYVYNQSYATYSVNDKLYLEFSYYTHKDTPVSIPKLVDSKKIEIKESKTPISVVEGNYVKNNFYYEIDISKYASGEHKEEIEWEIESISFIFHQFLEFKK